MERVGEVAGPRVELAVRGDHTVDDEGRGVRPDARLRDDPGLSGFHRPHHALCMPGCQLPVVIERPGISVAGIPFGDSNDAFEPGYRRFRLVAGSRVVADVSGFGGAQMVTVLRIDGDPARVLRGYARQLGRGGRTPMVRRVPTAAGTVLTVSNGPIGGGSATLSTDFSGRWLLIRANSD
jgi:hypothetical protein